MKNPFDDLSDLSDFVVAAPAAHGSGNVIGGESPPAPVLGAPIDITDETREAEASFAASGDGGPGAVVAVGGPASAGLTINLIFDAAAMAAPQSFRDGITAAMQQICAVVTDKITINIDIDYSGTGGGASAGPTGGNYVNYSTVRADLVNNASPGDTTFNSLPTGSTIAGQSSVAVWYAQEKLWGLVSPTGSEVDGSATFATDINPSLLVGVALHELTHAMGRVPYGSQPDIFDFYRFTSAGNYLFNGNSTAPPAYFSIDGGVTKLADYGQTSDSADFLNSGVQGSTDPLDEFYSGSTQQQLTATDLMQLDALGFHVDSSALNGTVSPAAPTVASFSPDSGTAGDGITNANQITLAGTAVAGSTVEVFDGATQIGTAVANGSGAWTFATATLADGNHAFTAKDMDAAGNLSTASAALTVTVDTVAPGAPTVASFSPDSGTVGDGITNANHITLAGTAAVGSTVEVFDGATQIGTATANASGAWTYATATLADGSHAFTTKAMDAAGNLSTASAALTVTVDTVAPGAPTVASFSPDSGTVGDGITNANHITLAGTAVAGSTVEVFDGATQIGTATANGSGAWTYATATLADGSHAFTAKDMDAAGNLSTASAALTVTVDTVAPGAPTVASFSPDSGTVGDGITNANHITLAGTAVAGSTVEVFDGATQIGTATANGSGAWTFATATLADGNHAFTAKDMDAAGNLSTASAALTVTVDTVAPGAPTVASFSPDSGTVGDGITNANHITLAGTAVAGSTVEVFDGATQIGTAVANGSGAWTYATGTLVDGSHAFTTKAMDAAGNLSTASAALTVTVDTVAPGAPTVASFSPDSGTVGDGITNANHITLAGTAVAGSTVEVFDGATQIGTATANGSGAWTYATATLADGSHAFTAKDMDAAGNLSTASAALTVTVDTVAPGVPTVASFSPDSGTVGDGITNANHITLAGTAVAGSTVEVFDGATQIGTATANASGAWTFATATLADGNHAFTAKDMDAAGNLSTASAALTVTVDTVAPGAPTVASFSPDSGTVGDGITNANHITLAGTAVAGSTVEVFDGVTQIGTAVANGSGAWTYATATLADGSHAFTSKAMDAAGNLSAASAALTVTVDTVAPGAPTVASFSPDSGTVGDGITNANHITLSGTAAVGSTVEVFDGATQIGTAVANGSGAWTYATGTLVDGSHAFTTKAMDAAGNLSTASAALTVTVDTVAPGAPTVASFSPDSGTVGDGITNANHITLAGTAVAGSTVEVFDGATQIGTATANGSGAWTYATATLADGSHAFTAKDMDAAGNLSTASAALTVTVDTVAPGAPTVASFSPDSGTVGDGITNANHITLAGTAVAGSTVEVFDGATQIGTATANGSGAWTFATATLADGNHAFTAKDMDAAGNLSTASAALTVTVDTVAPGAPTVASFSPDSGTVGDGITNANHITLAGTAVAGSTVEVFDGATQIGTAVANGSGAWTYATGTLVDGSHAFTSKAMDTAGNLSAASAALTVTVDTVAPSAPTLVSDTVAANASVDIVGTAEAGSKIALYEGLTLLSTGIADAHGNWTIDTGPLSAGTHDFTATATDAAGNVSALSADLDPVIGVTIESAGATELMQVGNDFFLNPVAGGSGPELMYGATPWAAGQAWSPIGAEKTSTGFEVALFNASTHMYTIWNTDGSGNVLSASLSNVSGTNTALESAEVSFQQDLNGDGTIGVPGAAATTIESAGATELVQVGNDFFLNPVAGGSGPELMYGATPWAAGQAWSPIGAEKTSTGYEVALFNASTHMYTIWNTDGSGNVLSASLSNVSGTNTALESAEVSFQQDLNGDGTIGVPGAAATTIESAGATELVQVGNDFFLNPVAGGSGPELMYGATPWAAGQAWSPIGAEKTSTGFEVALFNASTHMYTIWNTDGSGNVLSASLSNVSGTNTALESAEVSFQQDLNGDGTIGVPGAAATTIESAGATELVQVGNDFFLNPVAGGSGPELMYGATPWAAGQAWSPIGAEKTSTGYEVALFNASTHMYTIWNTDGSGNVLSASLSNVSGTNTALESAEVSFQQDLNGDGTLDTASTVIEASGTLKLNLGHVIQPAAIDAGSTLELTGTDTSSVTFNGNTGTLVLDHATQFAGTIIGLTGDGTAAHSDQIDLRDISFGSGTTVSYTGDASGGTLTVADAQNHVAHLSLVGNYTNSTFNLSSDGNGGTMVIDPPKDGFAFAPTPPIGASPSSVPVAQMTNDGFVFVHGANALGGAESPEHQSSVVGPVDTADHFFHQVWTEVSHEFAASPMVLDSHSVLAELHHFMLH